jgi:hypothetical protein
MLSARQPSCALAAHWRDRAGLWALDLHSGGLRESQNVFIAGNHGRNQGGVGAFIPRESGRRGRVGQTVSFDRVLRSSESLDAKLAYILDNPVRGGLVLKCEDYAWAWRHREHPYAVAEAAVST